MVFRDDPEVIAIGTKALRLQSITMVFLPVSLCGNMLFQSVGKGGRGTILASLRSGVLFIPAILLFSHLLGILGIQIAQPIADILAALVTIPFVAHFFARLPQEA
jgi:Na+-driven multidrug efflux pump